MVLGCKKFWRNLALHHSSQDTKPSTIAQTYDYNVCSSLISLIENELHFSETRKRLLPFITRALYQYGLNGYYQPDEVLNESFLLFIKRFFDQYELDSYYQTHEVLNKSFLRVEMRKRIENIPNIEAWFRGTAFNIIRQYARKRSRETLIPNEIYEEIPDLNSNSNAEDIEEYKPLREAFLQLPTEKQELLSLRFVRGLSWNEIADFYRERGEKVSAATLRKRHQRALNTLRQLVLSYE
jgi:RNA polymerase sigma factor (sigma-70 family)